MTDSSITRAPFRVLTRQRGGYDHQQLVDIQLQHLPSGTLVWSQTFSDVEQADTFLESVKDDLASLDDTEFRKKHAVPSSL